MDYTYNGIDFGGTFANFTYTQNLLIYTTPKVTASLSIIGSFIIIVRYLRLQRKLRSTYDRIVLYMSLLEIPTSIAFIIGVWSFPQYNNGTLELCRFQAFIIQFSFALPWWYAILATNFLLRIRFDYKEHEVEKLEFYYHIIAWTYPTITAFVSLGLDLYATLGVWCWISSKYVWAWWAFFYIPLWLILIYSSICMGIMVKYVFDTDKNVSGKVTGGKSNHVKQVTIQATLFICVFILTWLFGTINRIYGALYPTKPLWWLLWLHLLFAPLQGFLNFLVFIRPRYRSWVNERKEDRGIIAQFIKCYSFLFGKGKKDEIKSETPIHTQLFDKNIASVTSEQSPHNIPKNYESSNISIRELNDNLSFDGLPIDKIKQNRNSNNIESVIVTENEDSIKNNDDFINPLELEIKDQNNNDIIKQSEIENNIINIKEEDKNESIALV